MNLSLENGDVISGDASDKEGVTTTQATSDVSPTESGCYQDGDFYSNGNEVVTDDPCNQCYCINGLVTCARMDCMADFREENSNCKPQKPPEGQCCAAEYKCGQLCNIIKNGQNI